MLHYAVNYLTHSLLYTLFSSGKLKIPAVRLFFFVITSVVKNKKINYVRAEISSIVHK